MILRSALQTVWQETAADSDLTKEATHYSCSVSDEHSIFVVKHRADEETDYLLVADLLSNKRCELKFAPIRTRHSGTSNNATKTRVWTFEECGAGFGIVNFRTDHQTFGVAICSLNYRTKMIYSEEIQLLLAPNIPDTIFTTRKAQNGKIYLLEDPTFPMQIYNFENGYVDGEDNIRLVYDIQHRRKELEGEPDDYLCINDGIDKTCCELSVFLAHRKTGLVHNYITKLTEDKFPLKCQDRLVGNMQSVPFQNGVLALFNFEKKEEDQGRTKRICVP
ncbi:hypothetical protein M3Y97_00621300 [Aphelenchoides bicaudatus]|nr:hypothetical protein M3Y97_00621300 [Aphelenchoides bicaudatus]